MFESVADVQTIVDPQKAAESAALRYVSDARPGIRRGGSRKGFAYTRADGSKLTEADIPRRIRSLAIPPTWTDDGNIVLKVKSENRLRDERSGLKLEEAAVLVMLRSRLERGASPDATRADRTGRRVATIA